MAALLVRGDGAQPAGAAASSSASAQRHCFAGPCYYLTIEIYGQGRIESTVSDNLQKIVCVPGNPACTTEDWFNWADFNNPGQIDLTATGLSGQTFFGWDDVLGHPCPNPISSNVCRVTQQAVNNGGDEGWCMVARFGSGAPSATKTAGNCSAIPQMPVGRPVVVKKAGNGKGTINGPDAFQCNALCTQKSPSFSEGRFISFTVSAASGSHFVGWSGNMGCSGTVSCGFLMPCGDPDPSVCPHPSETLPQITATFALNNPPPPPPPPPPPTYNTVLLNHPPKTTRSRRATFGWGAKLGSSFRSNFKSQCKLGKKAWQTCRPGKTYKKLKPGKHTFKVRVAQKNTSRWDKTPATWTWKVKK